MTLLLAVMVASSVQMSELPTGSAQEPYIAQARKLIEFVRRQHSDEVAAMCRVADPIVAPLCDLASHLAGGKKAPRVFLERAAHVARKATVVWWWDELIGKHLSEQSADVFPSGFAARYIDEIASASKSSPEVGLRTLLELHQHADGLYADYLDETIRRMLREHPEWFYSAWSGLRDHQNALRRISVASPDSRQFGRSFRRLCKEKAATQRCK